MCGGHSFRVLDSRRLIRLSTTKSGETARCVLSECGGFIGTIIEVCFLIKTSHSSIIRRNVVKLFGTVHSFNSAGRASFGDFTRVYMEQRILATVGGTAERGRVPLGDCISLDGPTCSSRGSRSALVSALSLEGKRSPRRLFVNGRGVRVLKVGVRRGLDGLRGRILGVCLDKVSCRRVTLVVGHPPGSVSGTLRQIGGGLRGFM